MGGCASNPPPSVPAQPQGTLLGLRRPLHLAFRHRLPWQLQWPFSWSGSLNIPTTMPWPNHLTDCASTCFKPWRGPISTLDYTSVGSSLNFFQPWSPKRLLIAFIKSKGNTDLSYTERGIFPSFPVNLQSYKKETQVSFSTILLCHPLFFNTYYVTCANRVLSLEELIAWLRYIIENQSTVKCSKVWARRKSKMCNKCTQ